MAATRSGSKSSPKKNTAAQTRALNKIKEEKQQAVKKEVILITTLAGTILLFLCNFGIIGAVGNTISSFLFGIFGLLAYIVPVFIFMAMAFGLSNQGNTFAIKKIVASIILFLLVGMILELISGTMSELELVSKSEAGGLGVIKSIYKTSSETKMGGGVLTGGLVFLLYNTIAMAGAIISILVIGIICVVIVTEKSLISGVQKSSKIVYESAKVETIKRKEKSIQRKEENIQRQEEKQLRMDNKVTGVMADTTFPKEENRNVKNAIHEIHIPDKVEVVEKNIPTIKEKPVIPKTDALEHIKIKGAFEQNESIIEEQPKKIEEINPLIDQRPMEHKIKITGDLEIEPMVEKLLPSNNRFQATVDASSFIEPEITREEEWNVYQEEVKIEPIEMPREDVILEENTVPNYEDDIVDYIEVQQAIVIPINESAKIRPKAELVKTNQSLIAPIVQSNISKQEYKFPSIELLKKVDNKGAGETAKQLKETALQLQQTLQTFGVKVTVTDISQGPSVTRFELQPEQGVKVSKIVGLADDIKLNLAAIDIRIEAPIPGKAAVGIEIPNKETSMVSLRELFETKDFQEFDSNIAFAVGKDISGKTIVSDIGKMPHMLIAGATGSGKSVCINTLIMSILFKAHPDDVKMIMIDPKVVELSIYNGIPHLLIPVVTDPKKASAALHWGVAEMTDRYQKFADYNVRDLKGYNQKVEQMQVDVNGEPLVKMPQVVIIVDELADLMMVAPGEVESSICRLAQLARAAGIHLIIATQRPSVDVITGLIKANMPSRVAFSVSSGIDSRTILDMNGAEKLLGRGDMLFYPQGFPKPARIQGAFVSDDEVGAVVDFLKNQAIGNVYNDDISEKIESMKSIGKNANNVAGAVNNEDEARDIHFLEAGQFIIEKDKASIGMLQRMFKVGFNRAARIMDQLAEAGVVGEEEGTKARKILMTIEEFDLYIEENL